jgi:hypothetical protein
MKKARRRRNVVVKEVSLVDHPATKKKFVFFKSEGKKEVNNMNKDQELNFVDPEKEKELSGKTEEVLESLKETNREKSNLIKDSINSVNKVLSGISKVAGFTLSPSFKEISGDTALESEPAQEGPPVDEVINAFDSVYGNGADTVKGVFQGLASVVENMAASVGFKASMTFSKDDAEPEKESSDNPDETPPGDQVNADKDKEPDKKDEEELTEQEEELCAELEKIIEELSDPNIKPERYMEILERKGVIEFKLKGGDK